MRTVVVSLCAVTLLAAATGNGQVPPEAARVWTNAPAAVPPPVGVQPTVPQPAVVTIPPAFAPADPYAPPPPVATAPTKPGLPVQPPTARDLMSRQLRHTPMPTIPAAMTGTVAVTQPMPVSVSTKVGESAPTIHRRIHFTEPVMFTSPLADAILTDLQIFPSDNPWHQAVNSWPLHTNSKNIIAAIGNDRPLAYNLDMAFILVPPDQARRDVRVTGYAAESDAGPFPLPDNVPVEGWPAWYRRTFGSKVTLDDVQRDKQKLGGDRHAIIVDPGNRMLYEFFAVHNGGDGWSAGQASVFDLKTNKLRPDGWTSADAAGLPIFPAVVRFDELQRGKINHALRVTVPRTAMSYVAPARHFASKDTDPNLPRMGERLRLRASFDTSDFAPEVRTILDALKQYGMLVADNGSLFAISVAPDERMPRTLGQLSQLKCSDFEVVTAPQ